ncbi:hypothetical protein CERSUDRAFT_93960 [Gelatoporia subvermispora B]|uniref:DUF7918 domain-containing protein n=1 Tax=Ceriporiopsis subvermispora (strain B) TaxID=914234 RepID=M2RI27_CERS8|nr:hypothetical protein CERSUDRAFT_93960 [Gelatoporia subvermispora B]
MLIHRGFGAAIYCNGAELPQYNPKVQHGSIVSCYIPSEAGKEITIVTADRSGCAKLPAYLAVCGADGQEVDNFIGFRGGIGQSIGFRNGVLRCYPYMFTTILTTGACIRADSVSATPLTLYFDGLEDDEHAKKGVIQEQLGVIEANIYRITQIRGPMPTACPEMRYPPEIGPTHERSERAGEHRISFGLPKIYPQVSPMVHQYQIQYVETAEPFVTFRFMYLKKETLQRRGIIPGLLTPAPPPALHITHPSSSQKPTQKAREGEPLATKRQRSDDSIFDTAQASGSTKRRRSDVEPKVKQEPKVEHSDIKLPPEDDDDEVAVIEDTPGADNVVAEVTGEEESGEKVWSFETRLVF